MSGLDPQAPSQPSQQNGLNQKGNPASKTGAEDVSSQQPIDAKKIDHREQHDVPSQHGEAATSTSLGYGDTGALKEKDISASDAAHQYSKDGNLDGEQMRAPGEGDVAEAVRSGGGGGHKGQESLTKNLDDKKQEHEEELHRRGERTAAEIEEEEREDWTNNKADIGEALGGRGTKVVLAAEQ